MGLSRQEHWNRLPFPPPGDLPDPGIEPKSLASPALVGRFFTTESINHSSPEVETTLHIYQLMNKKCDIYTCICVYVYTSIQTNIMEYYLAIKSNDVLIHAITWMNLGNIMLSQRGQSYRPHIISFI